MLFRDSALAVHMDDYQILADDDEGEASDSMVFASAKSRKSPIALATPTAPLALATSRASARAPSRASSAPETHPAPLAATVSRASSDSAAPFARKTSKAPHFRKLRESVATSWRDLQAHLGAEFRI
mmetsp:Transcript_2541/g.6059  ORF Transcript_2541/g.6059 Transcript_2541/m.6059 type:complete len:127 (+) Transcript_2541:62-442(+)